MLGRGAKLFPRRSSVSLAMSAAMRRAASSPSAALPPSDDIVPRNTADTSQGFVGLAVPTPTSADL
jgi:hypothetical protein